MKLTKRWRRTHEHEQEQQLRDRPTSGLCSYDLPTCTTTSTPLKMSFFAPPKDVLDLSLNYSLPNRSNAVATWLQQNASHGHVACPLSPATPSTTPFMDSSSCTMGMGFMGQPTNNSIAGYATSSCSLSSSTSCFSSTSSSGFGDVAPGSTSPTSSEDQFSCLYLLASAAVSELERQRLVSAPSMGNAHTRNGAVQGFPIVASS